jgi:hypothetical protein
MGFHWTRKSQNNRRSGGGLEKAKIIVLRSVWHPEWERKLQHGFSFDWKKTKSNNMGFHLNGKRQKARLFGGGGGGLFGGGGGLFGRRRNERAFQAIGTKWKAEREF